MKKVYFLNFWLLLALGTTTVVFNSYGQSSTSEQGVIINGVRWATRNVAAPSTFAAKPEDAGMFYQWNRKKAWSPTGAVTGWDSSIPSGTAWIKANDPSPAGWRVPTFDEIKKLLDANKVRNEWTTQNGVKGKKFTDRATGNSLFLPTVGYLDNDNGTLAKAGTNGYYWSSTQNGSSFAYFLFFYGDYVNWFDDGRHFGRSVRSVVDLNTVPNNTTPNNATNNTASRNADVNHISDLFAIHLSENVAKLSDIVNLQLSTDVVMILTFIILGLSIGMHIMGRMWYEEGEFEGLQLPLFAVLFTALCILELIISMSGVNPLWFCSPSQIGWFPSIIGLFVLVYVINNQIKCFRLLMNELTSEYGYYSLRTKSYLTGILSGIIGFLVLCFYTLMLFGQGDVPASKSVFWTIASVVAALQILQAVIIYNRLETKKILISSIYLIGMLATFITLMYFMALLIIAIIVILVWAALFIMGKVQQSGRSSSSSTTSYEKEESNVAASCRSCSRFPGHAKYCDLGGRYVSDFGHTQACNYYRF